MHFEPTWLLLKMFFKPRLDFSLGADAHLHQETRRVDFSVFLP
jgi:hypothetical protein